MELLPKRNNTLPHWGLGLVALMLLYASIAATLALLHTPKVGYIDSSVLMEDYPAAIEAREAFNTRLEAWEAHIDTLEAELQHLNQEILAQRERWDRQRQQQQREAFAQKQREYGRYSRAVGEKAAQLEQALMEPVLVELNARIKDFGQTIGYDLILGTMAGGNILYAETGTDKTEAFLAFVQAQSQAL